MLCVLQDYFTRILIGTGDKRDGVYYFTGVTAARVYRADNKKNSQSKLWHRRLEHPPYQVLSALPVFDNLSLILNNLLLVRFVFAQNKCVGF